MSEQLTLASLFDGSGGFPLAGILSNIKPIWASEVALFPIRVTTKRLPYMKHYGNVSKINGAEVEPVDIITFGSPCQDLSLAGKRSGLDGERSGLFFEAIRIIKEMRNATNGRKPRYIVWENVYGAFSSNNGKDFQQVITEIAQIKHPDFITPGCEEWESSGELLADDFSVAWRGLDAQFWGVPQRRKRIFLVADFNGQGASKILFESEGLSRYSPESFRAWQRFAGNIGKSTSETNGRLMPFVKTTRAKSSEEISNFENLEVANTLNVFDIGETRCNEHVVDTLGISAEKNDSASYGCDGYNGTIDDVASTLGANCGISTGRNGVMVLYDQGGEIMSVTEDVTATLRSQMGGHPPLVMDPLVIENHPADSRVSLADDGKVQALTERMGTGGGNVPLIGIPYTLKIRCGKEGGGKGALIQENQSATLSCGNDQTLFVMATSQPNAEITENLSPTITAAAGMSGNNMPILIADARNGTLDDTAPSMQAAYDHTNNAGGLVMQAYGILRQVEGVQIGENKSPTIMAASGTSRNNKPSVAYSISSKDSNGFKSDNPKVGIYETEIAKTLDAADTLVATDYKDPPAVGFYPQMKAECMTPMEEISPTLLNGTSPGFHNGVVENDYIVRRLLPTECARLQGFPDWWCADLDNDEMGLDFWRNAFDEWSEISGSKKKSDKEILKWLKKPYSEAEEYKMWGNGVALPCVFFVLAGIDAWNDGKLKEEDDDLPLLQFFKELEL